MARLIIIMCFLLVGGPARAADSFDNHAVVIFTYHSIGEDAYPGSSLRQEQFAAHLRELATGGYTVMPLPAVIAAFRDGLPLPPRTVALTFDGGHRSVLEIAAPLLEEYKFPYTVFVATNQADQPGETSIGWNDLRRLKREGLATIGLHPAVYTRLYNEPEAELRRQINNARARYREEMGEEAALFAYPFGEYSRAYRDIIAQSGFAAAFAQHSGVAYAGSDLFALPRFSMTDAYGDSQRFRMVASALPLPVTDLQPADPLLGENPPPVGFTLDKSLVDSIDNLSCFASGQGRPELQVIGDGRVELRLAQPFREERARINCTLPARPETGETEPRWRWLGLLLIAPLAEEIENPSVNEDVGALEP